MAFTLFFYVNNTNFFHTNFSRRSLFAHDDAVMSVAFQNDTHYFFSAGKDSLIKYWDGDRGDLVILENLKVSFFSNISFFFQKKNGKILVLSGHQGPVWSLAVSQRATMPFVVSGGADRSWRVWVRTESPGNHLNTTPCLTLLKFVCCF